MSGGGVRPDVETNWVTERYRPSVPGVTRQCDGTARYAVQCKRYGVANEDGRYFCHDHADSAEYWTRVLGMWWDEVCEGTR
jgi:hypothetical protein